MKREYKLGDRISFNTYNPDRPVGSGTIVGHHRVVSDLFLVELDSTVSFGGNLHLYIQAAYVAQLPVSDEAKYWGVFTTDILPATPKKKKVV